MDAAFVTGTTQLSTSRSGSRTSSSTLNSREPPSHRIRMPDRLSPALRAMLAASPPPCGCSTRPDADHHRDSHLYQLAGLSQTNPIRHLAEVHLCCQPAPADLPGRPRGIGPELCCTTTGEEGTGPPDPRRSSSANCGIGLRRLVPAI